MREAAGSRHLFERGALAVTDHEVDERDRQDERGRRYEQQWQVQVARALQDSPTKGRFIGAPKRRVHTRSASQTARGEENLLMSPQRFHEFGPSKRCEEEDGR